MGDLIERLADENDRATLALANGFAIATNPKALKEWENSRQRQEPDAAKRQNGVLGRLAGWFPKNVKRRSAPG